MLLGKKKVVVCVGSGGVGKTTMAAALGIRAATMGRRVLVLTVDPAKRLATALGLDLTGAEERTVQFKAEGQLAAAVIDSKAIFDRFIESNAKDPELYKKLSRNRLYQQLSTTLSGSQEFTALERLLQAVESGKYDLIILDTPPTQHAIDFLSAPDRIRSLFQDSVTRWFMAPDAAGGILGSLIGRGTRAALKSLEVLTGARFIDELIDFFVSIRSIQKTLRERSDRVHQLLTSERATFILVTSFDVAKLHEARHLAQHLHQFGYDLGGCILNRSFPESLPDLPDEMVTGQTVTGQIAARALSPELIEKIEKVRRLHALVKADHQQRFESLRSFRREMPQTVAVLQVPEYRQDIFGLQDLESLSTFLGESAP